MVQDRDESGRFTKGNCANPGGRPKGLTEQVKALTGDGRDILAFLVSVMQGKERFTRLDHRLEAAQMLLDRGWGKAVQQVEQTTEQTGKLTIEVVRIAGTSKSPNPAP